MRILYWTSVFWPYIGGVETHGVKFLQTMQERGYEFAVATSHASLDLPDEATYNGVSIHRFQFLESLKTGMMDQIYDICKKVTQLKKDFKPDLVHISLNDPSFFFHLHTANTHPSPLLITIPVAPAVEWIDRKSLFARVLNTANWVTTCSAAIVEDIRKLMPDITPRLSVIYNGLDSPPIEPQALKFTDPTILCLGRVVEDKGFDLALEAFTSVKERFPDANLVIAGDGPARSGLENRAAELSISKSVNFIGWVNPENVPELINSATIVVVPSRWREAFGLVALEAALMSRPVVATRVGGLPEVVLHGQTGLLVEKEDHNALAEAISYLLDNPEGAVKMGNTARLRARKVFSWRSYVDAYETLYKKLIEEVSNT